jgi:hypothetical protein
MNTKVTVTFAREVCDDDSPADLSYLESASNRYLGESPANRAQYEKADGERLAAFHRGDWNMIGLRAKATIWIERPGYRTNYTLESPGIWGVESDSGEDYLAELFAEECATLKADIEAMKVVEFKS